MRKLGKKWSMLVKILSIILVSFHFYTAGVGILSDLIQRSIHLFLVLPLLFILKPATSNSPQNKVPIYDIVLAFVSVVSCAYVLLNYETFLWKPLKWLGLTNKYLAIVFVLIILEASRRCVGLTFPIMGVIFFSYAYFGPNFPDSWAHGGFGIDYIFQNLFHTTTGIWGTMVGLSSTILAMFAIFGAVLSTTGGAQTFIRIGQKATGKSIGGPGKVTIVSSGLFGMISGSAMANVVATGTFTIPLMKAAGYSPEWAAAISAMGSTGGQIMPPIMGSAAFIMAQMLGINYITVATAAIFPALFYYYGAFVAVHYVSKRDDIRGQKIEDKISMTELVVILAPIFIFLYFLARGYSVTNSAFYSTIASIIVYFLTYLISEKSFLVPARKTGGVIYNTAISGATSIIDMAALLAGAQITISLISMTGFGVKISDLIVGIGQNSLFLCLFLSMCVCILLGMGLPTTAAYVLAAAILVPALNQLGLDLFIAHMFVIYFSALATITPPVCAAVYLAAGIAEANWIRTGFLSVMIALPGFVIPYTFAYNPSLLLWGTVTNITISVLTAVVGVFFIGVGVAGYINSNIPKWSRGILVCSGIAMIVPNVTASLIGLVISLIMFFFLKKDKLFFKVK